MLGLFNADCQAVGLSDTIGFASAVDLRKHPKRLEETAILVF